MFTKTCWDFRTPGGSYLGDVNISAILDSFSVSYDKRVRPNYGGEYVSNSYFFLADRGAVAR